jgi:ABC-type multidrug transport system ATPase subunit
MASSSDFRFRLDEDDFSDGPVKVASDKKLGGRAYRKMAFDGKPKSCLYIWNCQFQALFLKCLETLLRKYVSLLAIAAVPILAILLLMYFKEENFKRENDIPFPESFELAPEKDGKLQLPDCKIFDTTGEATDFPCTSLAISWSGNPGTENLAKVIGARLSCSAATCTPTQEFSSEAAIIEAIFETPGVIDAALIVQDADSIGLRYKLLKNTTAARSYKNKLDDHFHYVKIQKAIEDAALRSGLKGGSGAAGVQASIKKFPELSLTVDGQQAQGLPNFMDEFGAVMLVFGLTLSTVLTMQNVSAEKTSGTLGLLRMTGLRESTYWLTWFLAFSLVLFAATFLVDIVGLMTTVNMVSKVEFGIFWLVNFMYSMAMVSVVLMVASAIKRPVIVQIVQFAVVLFSVMFQFVMAFNTTRSIVLMQVGSESPVDPWNSMVKPTNVPVAWIIFFFIPAFHYGKITQNIYDVVGTDKGRSSTASSDPKLAELKIRTFTWEDIFQPIGWGDPLLYKDGGNKWANLLGKKGEPDQVGFKGCLKGTSAFSYGCTGIEIRCTNSSYTLPSCKEEYCNTYSNCDWVDSFNNRVGSWYVQSIGVDLLYLLCNCVMYLLLTWYIAQVFSAGTGSSKSFIFFTQKSYWLGEGTDIPELVGKEKEEQELSSKEGSLRMLKLTKSYFETTALRELTLQMNCNEVFCLLGHNGAGKSSTINVLTGLHPPTHGEAFVQGLSIRHQMATIQSHMGVCPQDNVLFESLSGRSHLRFWGRFKGLSFAQAAEEAITLLESVGLTKAADKPAQTYSGGMKRRLSVAIASVATPRVVFLDEPTTGLDPLSRMKTWESISRLKEGRVVCLTTHSMEEADCLGDTIGIMAAGRLRALGTPLFLKSRYGSGYQLTFLSDESRNGEMLQNINRVLPTCEIISNVTGQVTVGVDKQMFALVPALFSKLEKCEGLVQEWAISASTLEEVFLKIAVQDKRINADVEGEAGKVKASFLYPGLTLDAAAGAPVHLKVVSNGKECALDMVTSIICSQMEQEDLPGVPDAGFDETSLDSPQKSADSPQKTTGPSPALVGAGSEAAVEQHMQVTVPEGSSAGGKLTVQTPDGQEIQVVIPEGIEAGQTFLVAYAPKAAKTIDTDKNEETVLPPAVGSQDQVIAHQLGALMIKNITVQAKYPKTNVARLFCITCCSFTSVLISLLFALVFAGASAGSPQSCGGAYQVSTEQFRWFAMARQDSDEYRCKKEDFVAFVQEKAQCLPFVEGGGEGRGERRLQYEPGDLTFRLYQLGSSLAGRGLCFNQWDCAYLESQDGFCVLPRTHTDFVDPTIAAAAAVELGTCGGGGNNFSTACDATSVLPDLCQLASKDLLTDASPWEPIGPSGLQVEYMNSIGVGLMACQDDNCRAPSENQLELLSTISIWHEGQFDISWLGDFAENKFVRPRQFGAEAAINFTCGTAAVSLEKKTSIATSIIELQQAGRNAAIAPQQFGCLAENAEGEGEGADAGLRSFGINFRRQDQIIPADMTTFDDSSKFLHKMSDYFSTIPDLGLSVTQANDATGRLVYDAWVYGGRVRATGDPKFWENHDYPFMRRMFADHEGRCVLTGTKLSGDKKLHTLVTALSDGVARKHWAGSGQTTPPPRIVAEVVPLPEIQFQNFGRLMSVFVTMIFFPMTSQFYFPVCVSSVQQECVEKNVLSMRVQGLKMIFYWFSSYLYFFFQYIVAAGGFWGANAMCGTLAFMDIDFGRFILVLVAWGHAQVSCGIALGTMLGKSKLTVIISYALILATLPIAMILLTTYALPFQTDFPMFFMWIPHASFPFLCFLVLMKGLDSFSPIEEQIFWTGIAGLFIVGTAVLIIGLVKQFTSIEDDSVFEQIKNKIKAKKPPAETPTKTAFEDDSDVKAEANRVASDSSDVVRVMSLMKEYPGGFMAVQGVSFGIKENECFGLLGPNGAGKTTVIDAVRQLVDHRWRWIGWWIQCKEGNDKNSRHFGNLPSVRHHLARFDCPRAFAPVCAHQRIAKKYATLLYKASGGGRST